MKKISLVELSQMEDKPKTVKIGRVEYTLVFNDFYQSGGVKLHRNFAFNDFNKPLIEIVEESLLTDEEREWLQFYLKNSYHKINTIRKSRSFDIENMIYLAIQDGENFNDTIRFHKSMFEGMEFNVEYTLERLGLNNE